MLHIGQMHCVHTFASLAPYGFSWWLMLRFSQKLRPAMANQQKAMSEGTHGHPPLIQCDNSSTSPQQQRHDCDKIMYFEQNQGMLRNLFLNT
jgi:hypothetical protein